MGSNRRKFKLSTVLVPVRESVTVEPREVYKQVTVRLEHKGVVLRGEKEGAAIRSKQYYVRGGQFIISKIDARNGAMGLVPDDLDGAIVTNDFLTYGINEEYLDPRYIDYLTTTNGFVQKCVFASEGSTNRVRIKPDQFLGLEITLPPLDEQRRIIARLDEIMRRVEEARDSQKKVATEFGDLRQAILWAACTGRLTADWREEYRDTSGAKREVGDLPEAWEVTPGNDVFDYVTSGSRGWAKYYSDTGAKFIRMSNLDHDTINLDSRSFQYVNPPGGTEGERTRIELGDILISITADVGMVALISEDIGEAYINQHIALARLKSGHNNRYLAWFLASDRFGQDQLNSLRRGATKVGLGLDDIRAVVFNLPPLSEQNEIVRRVELLFALTGKVEEQVFGSLTTVEELEPAVLDRAFRGEL